ncbi:hypothetical protein K2X85_08350 [bacterium]|nr:hypothetical protein [bacterium]
MNDTPRTARSILRSFKKNFPCLLIALYVAACMDFFGPGILEAATYEPPRGAVCFSRPVFFGFTSREECVISTAVSLDTPVADWSNNVPMFRTLATPSPIQPSPLTRVLLACAVLLTVYRVLRLPATSAKD